MTDWASQVAKPRQQPAQTQDWASHVLKPKTFAEAQTQRDANTSTHVDLPRLQGAQAARANGYRDPRDLESGDPLGPEVPIEGFVKTDAPEVGKAQSFNFGASLKSGLLDDPDTRRRVIAKSIFPNDPNGASRVGFIDDVPVYVDDQGQLRKVAPWLSRTMAGITANAPETALGVAGSFSASPVLGGTLGAIGGRGIKRAIAGAVFDEPQTVGGNLRGLAEEGAVNLGAGLVGKGVASVVGRGKIVDFTPADIRTAEQARSLIKERTGIDVDLAQASGNNKLIGLRAFAARYPGKSAELVQAAEEVQRGQLDTAVTRVLDQIATTAPAEVFGARGVNAATAVIEMAKGARDKAVAPLYDMARRVPLSGDVVGNLNTDPVLRHFARRVEKSPLYQRDLRGVAPDSVGFWHYVQQAMDDEINKVASEPNAVRILTQARKDLNTKLEAASPEFAEANAHYAQQTREVVEPLENSAIGVLARVTNPKAATVAARIFNDPNITAAEIRATRASIQKQDPEAWNGLVRQWISQNWNKALKETQTGSPVNPAGKLRQALMRPTDREKAAAMMPAAATQAFEDLMTATKALSSTPTAGSNTMRDTEIGNQLKGQGAVAFKWLTSWRKSVANAAEQKAIDRNTLAITEAILDPAKQKQLRQVVKMTDGARKAFVLSGILAGQSLSDGLDRADERIPTWPPQPERTTEPLR